MNEINKNIPVPPARKGRFPEYPFGQMEVGDSFFVDGDESKIDSAKSASRGYGKRHNKRFRTRQEFGGVRIWRIV